MKLHTYILTLLALAAALPAWAQTSIPDMPEPVKNLKADGAQVEYMGRDHGFDSWLSVKNGQEQYFYVPPGGTGFVMGVLFDQKGRVVTVDQIQRLRAKGGTLLDSLASASDLQTINESPNKPQEFASPSERLFYDTQNTNWVKMGYASAPVVYAIIDPQCPHCHAMVSQLHAEGYFQRGAIQLRLIPVGFVEKSKKQAAFLMAAPNPEERFLAHLQGDDKALPVREDINTQGVERNMAYMQSWKFDVTPMLVYRNGAGEVKIVRGRPKDVPALLNDLKPVK